MTFLKDILDTWRISRKPGSNYRAIHAGSAMVIGFVLMVTSIWCLLAEWPTLSRAGSFFILALCSLLYWRYLLPEAMWRANIESAREANKAKPHGDKKNGGA